MRKIKVFALLIAAAFLMMGCGISKEEHEAVVSENEDLKAQVEQLKAEKASLTTEKESLTAQKDGLTSEKETLTAEKEALEAASESLKTENETLSAKVQELTDEVDSFANPSLTQAQAAMGDKFKVTDVKNGNSKILIIWCSITVAEADDSYSIGEDLGKRVALMMKQRWFDYDRTFVNFELDGYGTVSSMEFFGSDPSNSRSIVWETE